MPVKEFLIDENALCVVVLPGKRGADLILIDKDGAVSMRSNTELFNKLLSYGADLSTLSDVANFLDAAYRELIRAKISRESVRE